MELDWESVLCREGISHPTKKVGVLNFSEQLWRWGFSISCLAIGESIYCAILSRNLRMWLKELGWLRVLRKDCHLTMVFAFILRNEDAILEDFLLVSKEKERGNELIWLKNVMWKSHAWSLVYQSCTFDELKGLQEAGGPPNISFLNRLPYFFVLCSRKSVGEAFPYGCAVANFLFS